MHDFKLAQLLRLKSALTSRSIEDVPVAHALCVRHVSVFITFGGPQAHGRTFEEVGRNCTDSLTVAVR